MAPHRRRWQRIRRSRKAWPGEEPGQSSSSSSKSRDKQSPKASEGYNKDRDRGRRHKDKGKDKGGGGGQRSPRPGGDDNKGKPFRPMVPCKTTSRKRARAREAENIKKFKKNTRPTSCGTAPVPPPFLAECPGTCPGPGTLTQGCRREPRAQSGEVFFKVCRRFGILMDF